MSLINVQDLLNGLILAYNPLAQVDIELFRRFQPFLRSSNSPE